MNREVVLPCPQHCPGLSETNQDHSPTAITFKAIPRTTLSCTPSTPFFRLSEYSFVCFCYPSAVCHIPAESVLFVLWQDYKIQTPTPSSILRPPATPSLLAPYILLSTLYSNILTLCYSLFERPSFKPIRNSQNYSFVFPIL